MSVEDYHVTFVSAVDSTLAHSHYFRLVVLPPGDSRWNPPEWSEGDMTPW